MTQETRILVVEDDGKVVSFIEGEPRPIGYVNLTATWAAVFQRLTCGKVRYNQQLRESGVVSKIENKLRRWKIKFTLNEVDEGQFLELTILVRDNPVAPESVVRGASGKNGRAAMPFSVTASGTDRPKRASSTR